MSIRATGIFLSRSTTVEAKRRKEAELEALHNTPGWETASPDVRARAERSLLQELNELKDALMRGATSVVEAEQKNFSAKTKAIVQRRAGVSNPSHASAMGNVALLGGPLEARKLAELLAAENDAAGAYGLRLAIASFPPGSDSADAVSIALNAGTSESDEALRNLLAAQREYARSVGLFGTPEEKLAAAHQSQLVREDDGTETWYSEDQITEMIGAPRVEG